MKKIIVAMISAALLLAPSFSSAAEQKSLFDKIRERFGMKEKVAATPVKPAQRSAVGAPKAAAPQKKTVLPPPKSFLPSAQKATMSGQEALPQPVAVLAPVPASAPDQVKVERPVRKAKPIKDMTKAELIEQIKYTLRSEEEIFGYMPDLKLEEGPGGEGIYTFNGTSLDSQSEPVLKGILTSAQQIKNKIHTEKIQRQLDNMRNIQQLQNTVQQTQRLQSYSTPPAVPQLPPHVPSPLPAQPPQPLPRVPTTPPQPPRR